MSVKEAVAQATDYLNHHPEEARYRDAAAVATLTDGLHTEIVGPDGASIGSDMPRGIGGAGSDPSPGWLYRAAMASCVAALIGIRAAMVDLKLPAGSVEVTVDSESDDHGILGLDEGVPAGPLSVRVKVAIAAPDVDRTALEGLVAWAVDHCPVTDATRRAVPLEIVGP